MEELIDILKDNSVVTPQIKAHVEYHKEEKDKDREAQYINEFSVEDNQILHAWYVLNAIEKFENLKDATKGPLKLKIDDMKKNFYWAFTWQKKIEKMGEWKMQGIEQHLKEVCKYHLEEYKQPYGQQWLLDLGKSLYDKLKKEYLPYMAKKEETTATDVSEI